MQPPQRRTLKLAARRDSFPTWFYLKDVRSVEAGSRESDTIADLYLGEWKGQKVALKRLRVDKDRTDATEALQRVCSCLLGLHK